MFQYLVSFIPRNTCADYRREIVIAKNPVEALFMVANKMTSEEHEKQHSILVQRLND